MKGTAGSKESNDCLITIESSVERKIEINSIVGVFFYDQILKVVEDTLDEQELYNVKVIVEDKGALDYTIKSRLLTAIERMREDV
ncbi:MAG: citrate lyase acyl carrier protein [Tenericutes bacterium HGW-Tenericutes-5]|jgi:citrate lyase subunit gamma (acyl carrier protein)|nr:MAG: citrate lyase acyl carrier protein [Tenericutes bacterium HGW-Tenericutes-5]